MKDKNLERIIRYLDGEMDSEEKRLFEQELVSNKSLNQLKCLMEEVDQVIDDEQTFEFREKLKSTQELYNAIIATKYVVGIESEESFVTGSYSRVNWKHIAAATITLLIVLFTIIFNFSKPSHKKIFASYYHPYKIKQVMSRTTYFNYLNQLIDAAAKLYDKSNYKGAIDLCEQIIKIDTTNTAAYFFTGISFIELHDYEKAIDNLSFVIRQSDIFYIKHAKWYLALCYLETNQIKRAASVLNNVVDNNDAYKRQALELLKKIQ